MAENDSTVRVGVLATWWRGDDLPELATEPSFTVALSDDVDLLARLVGVAPVEVEARLRQGHRAYLARLEHDVVGYGWSATRAAEVGALGLHLRVPDGNRYLWDFATLPRWRGRGVYPRLLQAIVRAEQSKAERFWIGYDWGNHASGRGIIRAGFQAVGAIDQSRGGLSFVALGALERARAGAAIFGMNLVGPSESKESESKASKDANRSAA